MPLKNTKSVTDFEKVIKQVSLYAAMLRWIQFDLKLEGSSLHI
jgi:hypothetical protein